jgi:hypothetical protein
VSEPVPLRWRVRATCAAVVIPPLLRLVSFGRLATWLGGAGSAATTNGDGVHDASLAGWVDALLRRLPGPWRHTCLKRSAVLYHLLRKAGRPVELWIGVRRDHANEGSLAAHAWLVRDGVPYLEPEPTVPSAHTVIARFPEPARSAS